MESPWGVVAKVAAAKAAKGGNSNRPDLQADDPSQLGGQEIGDPNMITEMLQNLEPAIGGEGRLPSRFDRLQQFAAGRQLKPMDEASDRIAAIVGLLKGQ